MDVDDLDQMRIEEASFVVLDFETVTPKGRPPEPIELAAMCIGPGLKIDSRFQAGWLIKPPEEAPITPFDTAQTGIRWEDVRNAPSAATVITQLETSLRDKKCVLVAQNARYEFAVVSRFSTACPRVAEMPFIDTVKLAKYLVPSLPNHKLDTLANYCSVPIPVQRHRALPDVKMTVQVFLKLLEIGRSTNKFMYVIDLRHIAGIETPVAGKQSQMSLFE